jgi:hypothetical protein
MLPCGFDGDELQPTGAWLKPEHAAPAFGVERFRHGRRSLDGVTGFRGGHRRISNSGG